MKKEDVASLVIYLLIIAGAVLYSFTVLRVHFTYSSYNANMGTYALYIIVSIISGVLIASIFSELGHMLGAKIGGYYITSVDILGFCFYKDEKKWKFRFKSFDGFTGETKIKPKNEKSDPRPFLLTPSIVLAVIAIGAIVIFNIFNASNVAKLGDLAYFALTIGIIVLIVLIYNIIPIKLDSRTDGYNLMLISKKGQKEAFNAMLLAGSSSLEASQVIEAKKYEEVNNITAELSLENVSILLGNKSYDEADEMVDKILENKQKVSGKNELRCEAFKIYIQFMSKDLQTAIKYSNDNVDLSLRRALSSDASMASIRAYVLIAALVDDSKSECLVSIKRINAALKNVGKERKQIEADMYNDVIDLVNQKHPKWEFDKYRIVL